MLVAIICVIAGVLLLIGAFKQDEAHAIAAMFLFAAGALFLWAAVIVMQRRRQ